MFSRRLECELALNQLHLFFTNETSYVIFFLFLFPLILLFFWGEGGRSFLRVYVTFVFVVVVFLSCLLRICLLICIFESFSML